MTIGQINIILVLKGLSKWQRKWGKANEKWKRDWVLSDVDWEELRERVRPELDEALSVGDRVFFAKVKKGLQVLQPLAEDAKDSSEYKLIKYIEEYVKKYTLVWGNDEPQPEQADPEPQQIPEELNTEQGRELLRRSIEGGFCDEAYRWLKTKALLAYYSDKASEYLRIGKGFYDGREKTSWKPFEALFRDKDGGVVSNLSGARNDYTKKGVLPKGYNDIDLLFNH